MVFHLLLFIPAGLVAAFVGYGSAPSAESASGAPIARCGSGASPPLLGDVAAALYPWGLLHVASAVVEAEDGGTNSSPLRPCRTPGHWERALSVVNYTVDYVPLRFVRETKDGRSYAAESVPGYVNPAVLCFALAAAVCAVAAVLESQRRAGKGPAV
jgi:hypothetical protein